MTDAAGINIASLPASMQITLLGNYFGSHGIEYTVGRIPIAGCDFSTYAYSYCDVPNDDNLTHFNLTKEDMLYKVCLTNIFLFNTKTLFKVIFSFINCNTFFRSLISNWLNHWVHTKWNILAVRGVLRHGWRRPGHSITEEYWLVNQEENTTKFGPIILLSMSSI